MSMLLLDSYSFGDRRADIFQMSENFFRIDCYMSGRIVSTHTNHNLMEAKKYAEAFTDGKNSQLLNENA